MGGCQIRWIYDYAWEVKAISSADDDSLYHLEKNYFMHKTSADLKIIAILSGTYVYLDPSCNKYCNLIGPN